MVREFKSRRPHQTWPNLVRDEQDFWQSGCDVNLKVGALVAHHITWTLGLALRVRKDPSWLDYGPRVRQLVCSGKLVRESASRTILPHVRYRLAGRHVRRTVVEICSLMHV